MEPGEHFWRSEHLQRWVPQAPNGVDKDGGRRIPGLYGGTSNWEGGETKVGGLPAAGNAPTGGLTKVVGRRVAACGSCVGILGGAAQWPAGKDGVHVWATELVDACVVGTGYALSK